MGWWLAAWGLVRQKGVRDALAVGDASRGRILRSRSLEINGEMEEIYHPSACVRRRVKSIRSFWGENPTDCPKSMALERK
jgi:hypothetical protein